MTYRLLLLMLATGMSLLSACGDSSNDTQDEIVERATRVSTATPEAREIAYVLTALGGVESISSPTISAETNGRITELSADVGTRVESGQLLARIDDSLHQIQAAEARAEFQRIGIQVENQRSEVDRLKQLARSQSVSKDQLEDQQDQLRMLTAQQEVAQKRWEHAAHMSSMAQVKAPHAGSIAHRHVSLGDYVSAGQPLFDLVSTDRLRARLAFPERDASSIRAGLIVELSSPASPGNTALGRVTQVNPRIRASNRAVEILVEFENPGGWYPGSSVDATLELSRKSNALTVPRLAVVVRDGRDVVFVAENSRASARPITLGWQETEWVEVTSGLRATDRVVIEGASLLAEGSLLATEGTAP